MITFCFFFTCFMSGPEKLARSVWYLIPHSERQF